jgi:MscS family membrane protein
MTSMFLILLSLSGAVDDVADAGCASPRDVMRGFVEGQGEAAARCLALPSDMTRARGQRAVLELRAVADARGVLFRLDSMPDSPDWVDPRTSEARFVPSPTLPTLELVKTKAGWAFSPSTLRAAHRLHERTFVVDLAAWSAQRLPPWMMRELLGVAGWQLLGILVLSTVGLVVRRLVSRVVLWWLRRLAPRLGQHWSDEVLRPVARSPGLLVLAGVVALGLPQLALPAGVAATLGIAVRTVAALSVVIVVYRLVDVFAETLRERAAATDTKLDDQVVPLVRRLAQIATVTIGGVFVLQNLQVDVGSLVAGLGLGGLAFALAAKDTISHLFGSITVFLDKPFSIGDWVVTCGVEGTVEEVGFRSTRVRTFGDTLVTIPNGKLTDAIVDNWSRRRNRRCHTTLNVVYATTPAQMEAFCDGIRAIVLAHPSTKNDDIDVAFKAFGGSSLDVLVSFFWTVASWSDEQRARHEVFLAIWRLADELGVRFAFPTQTLYVEQVASPSSSSAAASSTAPDAEVLRQIVARYGPGGDGPRGPGFSPMFLASPPTPPPTAPPAPPAPPSSTSDAPPPTPG